MIFDDPDLTNTVKDMGAGGLIAAALWGLWSKLRAITSGDKADAATSAATASVYELLLAENKRMATRIEELSGQVDTLQKALDDERESCRATMEQFMEQNRQAQNTIIALQKQVDDLMRRIQARESEDELGRSGKLERRASA